MEHLRLFETESEYLEAKDNFVSPNVSYIMEDDMVYYMKLKSPNYEFVDLGLSVKWATCNIGATKPEESGLYFAWGETKGYMVTQGDGVDTTVIKNADGTETTKTFASDWTDYENGSKYNEIDGLTTLENEDDGCYLAGKNMRMPTMEECEELINGTTSAWTTNYNGSGINGVVFTSESTHNSIFIPAAGIVYDGMLNNFGFESRFYSRSLFLYNPGGAYFLYCTDSYLAMDGDFRPYGCPLRAVCP